MKITKKDEVFEDTLSGVQYTKEHAILPIAMVDGPGKVTKFGVLLKPYYAALPDDLDEESLMAGYKKLGYVASNPAQHLLVAEKEFRTRFKSLGVLSEEVDLEALVAKYREEECDLSNRPAVIRSVMKQLADLGGGLWAAEVYVLLKNYIANTPAADE